MTSEQDYSGNYVLLTGGTGFFGRALLRHWQSQEQNGEKIAKVCVLSRNPESFLKQYPEFSGHSWLHFHQGDILSTSTLPRGEFTHLLHAATDSTLGPKLTPIERYIQIVDGTRNMLEYAVATQIPRFLLISSGGVYGPQPHDIYAISESLNTLPDPLNAENTYSIAKRCAEHLCSLYKEKYGLQIVVARCFAFVGRDMPLTAHFAIGNFIYDALHETEIIINGDGTPIRTYLDQRDLSHWLTTLMYEGKDGEAYNVGSDIRITINELAKVVRNIIAPLKKIHTTIKPNNGKLIKKYIPDITKAKTDLKLDIKYNLQDSIKETAKWNLIK